MTDHSVSPDLPEQDIFGPQHDADSPSEEWVRGYIAGRAALQASPAPEGALQSSAQPESRDPVWKTPEPDHDCHCEGQPWCVPHLGRAKRLDPDALDMECHPHDHVDPQLHDYRAQPESREAQ